MSVSIALPSLLEKEIAARLTIVHFPGFGYIYEFILENKASNLDLVIVSVFCFDYCFLRVMKERYGEWHEDKVNGQDSKRVQEERSRKEVAIYKS
ncbi:hypothetical protein [uncultured Nostoc sp.]|uniref:hypothetical protein n=1 Tax=uncultured Nostoc sp. TaxID=340711 RepID=UPI0035CA89F5